MQAQYLIKNRGETRNVKLALPFLADYDEAVDFIIQKAYLNSNEIDSSIYVGGCHNSYYRYGKEEKEIDFRKEFLEATSPAYTLPELSGRIYKIKSISEVDMLNVTLEYGPETKIILGGYQYSNYLQKIYFNFYPSISSFAYFLVLGETNDLHINCSDEVNITDEEISLFNYYEEYLQEPENPLKNQITKHDLKNFLTSETDSAINQSELKIHHSKRLWFYVFEPELVGDSTVNTFELSYQITGHINKEFNPPTYEFRYYLSSTRYWKEYSHLVIRVYPSEEIKYPIKNYYKFTSHPEGYFEAEVSSYPEEMLLVSFCEKANPSNIRDPKPFLTRIIIAVIILVIIFHPFIPFVILIIIAIIIYISEKNKKKRYKKSL